MKKIIRLLASEKYDAEASQGYYLRHQDHFSKRLASLREAYLVRKALQLSGQPRTVMDIPCGDGRYWPLLTEHADREVIAADDNALLLDQAWKTHSERIKGAVSLLHTCAQDIALPDQSVDSVLCMRLFHHLADPQARANILREFARVSRRSVILSLWVSNHFKPLRRQRTERLLRDCKGQAMPEFQSRYVLSADVVEEEFKAAGFRKVSRLDYLPFCGLGRIYVLQR